MDETKVYSTLEIQNAIVADTIKEVAAILEEKGYNYPREKWMRERHSRKKPFWVNSFLHRAAEQKNVRLALYPCCANLE